MINEFKTREEALTLIKSVVDKYIKDVQIHSQGSSTRGLIKTISFMILASPSEDLEDMKDELILLRAKGYPINEVVWTIKWADQLDMVQEIISVSVNIKVYKK